MVVQQVYLYIYFIKELYFIYLPKIYILGIFVHGLFTILVICFSMTTGIPEEKL